MTDEEMREQMAPGWPGGNPETVCGNGSTLAATKNIRFWLPLMCDELGIKSINDAGAGDMHWINGLLDYGLAGVEYFPFDLIPRSPEVVEWDITSDPLPKADAILCRMVLNHLPQNRVVAALDNFVASGARYLFVTDFIGENLPKRTEQYTRWRMSDFGWSAPISRCRDSNDENCFLAIYEITTPQLEATQKPSAEPD